MDIIQAIFLALIQGLTEFLPISSSGHLILVPELLGWADQGLAFDVAVHVGTLLAVVFYFRKEIARIFVAWIRSLSGSLEVQYQSDAKLAWGVLLGTIPAGLAGLLANDFIEANFRSILVIAITTIGFCLLLWWSDVKGTRQRGLHQLNWRDVGLIGIAQALALIPGTSRSGITMTAALMTGLDRQAAARFSFLLSIPIIVLAGGYKALGLLQQTEAVQWTLIGIGTLVSAVVAYLSIRFFLALLDRIGMAPFAIYRLLLGAILLGVYFF
ncbi:MAG: undecaprenyl-diphosphate phosphatase [Gammaproteobacteria bacterium]|nr:undecaprenyl-diphosphate phosphatase [Gammaproteobacteria bacterium]